jgi:curved DNA-binding protein CbpA
MAEEKPPDYYEMLQISQNAEPETINRVFRLFAQRFHPDNTESGDANRFREVHDAYSVLSDPEKRAKYDVGYQQQRQDRWRLVSSGQRADNNFDLEAITRLTVLEVLYTQRRTDPQAAGVYQAELETLTGRAREHLEFTIWYLVQKGLIARGDSSRLNITAEGVDYLEKNYQDNAPKRLTEPQTSV